MESNKFRILKNIRFGNQVAEEERDDLKKYFVETQSWRKILNGEVDVIYGPKGSGKSALYLLVQDHESELFDKGIILVVAENPRGAPAFENLKDGPAPDEKQFISLWKIYFLSLIGREFEDYNIKTEASLKLIDILKNEGLLPKRDWSLKRILERAKEYVAKYFNPSSIEFTAQTNEVTGGIIAIGGKINFNEKSDMVNKKYSIDELYEFISETLIKENLNIWLLLDRLDVAFDESEKLEKNALRALFKAYRDLRQYERITLKIFLRTDIWERITGDGFREATHISREIRLSWDKPSLLNLVARRFLSNTELCHNYGINAESAINDVSKQKDFISRILPEQVEIGKRQSEVFDWILKRTADATGQNAPREIIFFFIELISEQLKRFERGETEPQEEALFDRSAFKDALPELSNYRLHKVLFSEYPGLRRHLEQLSGQKSEQNPKSLSRIWGIDEAAAKKIAGDLVKIGFFEYNITKPDIYRIPFIYRPALSISQGKAEELQS